MQQEYVGQLVRLRPLEDDDLDAVMSLYRSTTNYWAAIGYGREPVSKLQLQSDFLDAQRTEGRVLFAIVRCEDNALIGVADVQLEAIMSDTATIALLLVGGQYQQHGYGSEAADLLERALFAQPEIEFIMAGVAETSELGQRFWLRRGYHYSGSTTHDPQSSRTTIWLAKKRPATATAQPGHDG
ncbi:MAG TPA: GNAT family N-acetyltransferase [Herpetosiphonaceae bacterium]